MFNSTLFLVAMVSMVSVSASALQLHGQATQRTDCGSLQSFQDQLCSVAESNALAAAQGQCPGGFSSPISWQDMPSCLSSVQIQCTATANVSCN